MSTENGPGSTKFSGREKTIDKRAAFGIKMKLIFTLIPTVIAIVALILFIINKNSASIVLHKSESILAVSTESVKNSVIAWMNTTITALNTERDTIEYFSMNEKDEKNYIIHTADQYESFPAGIYLATTAGELIHASFVPGPDYVASEKSWYQEGIKSEKFIFGSVYYDEDSQAYVVGASGILKDKQGIVRGVAAADIYLDAISEIVKQVTLEKTGGVFLVDTNTNMIIGDKDAALVGTLVSEQENKMYAHINDMLTSGTTGLQKYTSGDGNNIYLDLQKVPDSKWAVVAHVPEKEIMADLSSLTIRIIEIAIVGILFLAVFMERLIHFIVKPIKKISRNITSITEGDFTTEVTVKTSDEIGIMAAGLASFIKVMRGIIGQIGSISGTLGKQSENSAAVAEKLSGASNLQLESMKEMSSTINELALSISEVAESTTALSMLVSDTVGKGKEANEEMAGAVKASDSGRSDMEKVVAAMEDITQKMGLLEIASEKMDASVVRINAMVELIGDIAEETNLLSLNASIEAARVGESGKGFAVVASQIGKLAATSKTSVDDITKLIGEIGSLVRETVDKTGESSEAIKKSVDLVNDTGRSFTIIYDTVSKANSAVSGMVDKINQVNDIAANVAGITEEQSAASQEILATTENIRGNAEEVFDNSKSVEDASEALLKNAEQLNKCVERFRI